MSVSKPVIWLIDTSVLLNILDVKGFNQNREEVIETFAARIENEDTFLLPFTTILETGNHIGQLADGNLRRKYAQDLTTQVQAAFNENAPYRPLDFPTPEQLNKWIIEFPASATATVGLGDHLIIKHWEAQRDLFKNYQVTIWSLDGDLQGYSS